MTGKSESAHNHNSITVGWRSPSNIALVKYWGKKNGQIPLNPSLSFSLSHSYSETFLTCVANDGCKTEVRFFLDGTENHVFGEKIRKYFENLAEKFSYLHQKEIIIRSHNTFPHSAGIASSASGFSALALCLSSLLFEQDKTSFFRNASGMARLGSGSACRSVYGGFSLWGKTEQVSGSSDEFAIPLSSGIHDSFARIKDAILVLSTTAKNVSSTAGHSLMDIHPFKENRVTQAKSNIGNLLSILQSGDWEGFIRIVEEEALTLHSLMFTSNPSVILIQPQTLAVIDEIRKFRISTGTPLCFTIDAGPNIHLLYPETHATQVKQFINEILVNYCEKGFWIDDCIGSGPEKIA